MFATNRLRELFELFWPIALSMLLTSILGFLDSAMMSHYDTYGVSAINFASQFLMIFGPAFFGIVTGINIYTVQYYQRKEYRHLSDFFKLGLVLMLPVALLYFTLVQLFNVQIINFFIDSSSHTGQMAIDYLKIISFNTFLMPIDMMFIYQFRAIKKPKIPLVISTLQSITNIILNFFLIFGIFGFPELGISGAAIATVLTRLIYVFVQITIANRLKAPFIQNFRSKFSLEFSFIKEMLKRIWPLVLVELGFGIARVIYTKLYSYAPIDQYNAMQIAQLISFMLNSLVIATASASSILMGSELAKHEDGDVDNTLKNIWSFMAIASVLILVLSSIFLPLAIPFFETNNQELLVHKLIVVNAIYMAIRVLSSGIIALLKSGGDTKKLFLIDAGMSYLVGIPLTALVLLFHGNGILALKVALISEVIAKAIVGLNRMRQNIWRHKL